jgi:phosphoglycerol transferase MdoB-like AlkP superfamily enzyme
VSEFLQGATFLASLAVALFFLRFWRETREPLFAVLSGAFVVFAANRVLLAVLESEDRRLWVYATRALVFALIAAAVVAKNLDRR